MKKLLIALYLTVLPVLLFGQNWQGGLGNTLQRAYINGHWQYRFNLGNSSLGYYYPPRQTFLDSALQARPILPIGQRGQVFKVAINNTNQYLPVEPLIYGQFIYTDDQLSRAFSRGTATQQEIFNSFLRFSHGTDAGQSNSIPGIPLHTNSWSYDTTLNTVKSTLNTNDAIGFFSNESYEQYIHTMTLSSGATDNDNIGVVIAFVQDTSDMVPNQAYGLDPADFNWPIDVTHPTIPNQHSLIMFRNRNGAFQSYTVFYDVGKLTQQVIADGTNLSGLYNTTAGWTPNSVDIRIERNKDTILTTITNFSDAPGGKGPLAFPLVINLNSNPVLAKFKGAKPYGYACASQQAAAFSNIYFSGSNNLIYDLRNGDTYQFLTGGYTIDPTKNMYTDLGTRFFWRNIFEHTYGYILPTNTYDVIVGEP